MKDLLNLKALNKTILLLVTCSRMCRMCDPHGALRRQDPGRRHGRQLLEDTNTTVIRAPSPVSTIDRIERVLQEEKVGIEQVSQPQRLEDLFLDIVESAQRGRNLRSDGDGADGSFAGGESLIDSLVTEIDAEPAARAVERTEVEGQLNRSRTTCWKNLWIPHRSPSIGRRRRVRPDAPRMSMNR